MEEVSTRPLSWSLSVHNIIDVRARRTIHRRENGDFDFEAINLIVTDENGRSEEFGIFSQVEGSLTRIPVTSTD